MTSSILFLCTIIAQITGISCFAWSITCPQKLRNVSLQIDHITTLVIEKASLTVATYDDWKFYSEDGSNVNIIVHNAVGSILADMVWLDSPTQETVEVSAKYLEYNYQLHGFAQRKPVDGDQYELGSIRMLTVPYGNDDVYYMPDIFKYRLQKEIEICLEIQISSQFSVLHKNSFLEPPAHLKGCPAPELHYTPPSTTDFQDQINKVADIVVHKVITEFLDPTEGEIPAPEFAIQYRQYIVLTGTFRIFNGKLRDLRTFERKSNVTVSRTDQFLILSGSFDIKNISLLYNNYSLTGIVGRDGNNVTIDFEGGIIADVIVHLDNSKFPCGITLHKLKLTSPKPGTIKAADASRLINSSVKDEFRKQNTEILRKFADKLREYIASEMDKYDCERIRFLDFLEKSLTESLKKSNETEKTLDDFKKLLGGD